MSSRQAERKDALDALKNVLEQSSALEDYVASLDQDSEVNNFDSPIIRKAIGQVYQEREQWKLASIQFQKALELQPNDLEVHEALIACSLNQNDRLLAGRQTLAWIAVDRRNLKLYTDYATLVADDPLESERALTSIIEAAPNEAENHQELAQIRQSAERRDEAIAHWQRVAELRRLEPTGLLGLARTQIDAKQWDRARATLDTLRSRDWPEQFNQLHHELRQLEAKLPRD